MEPTINPNDGEFEFTPEQDAVFAELSKRMKWFAGLMVASSILSIVVVGLQLNQMGATAGTMIGGLAFNLLSLGIYIVIATLTVSAASSLQQVVTTHGSDITHMVNALRSIKQLFAIQYWLIVIALLFVVVAMPAAFVLFGVLGS